MSRIEPGEYNAHFEPYVAMTRASSVGELIADHSEYLVDFVTHIADDKAVYRYAEGKWNVKEVLQHIIDMERVFAYRALSIARGVKDNLPGVDQDLFAASPHLNQRAFSDIQEEFVAMRADHNMLFRSFNPSALMREGLVSGNKVTCRSWIFISFGHSLYHVQILKDRYGIPA